MPWWPSRPPNQSTPGVYIIHLEYKFMMNGKKREKKRVQRDGLKKEGKGKEGILAGGGKGQNYG